MSGVRPLVFAAVFSLAFASFYAASAQTVTSSGYYVANATNCVGSVYPCEGFEKQLCINTWGESMRKFAEAVPLANKPQRPSTC